MCLARSLKTRMFDILLTITIFRRLKHIIHDGDKAYEKRQSRVVPLLPGLNSVAIQPAR